MPTKEDKARAVPVSSIPDHGGYFRKVGGEYVHLRISASSVKFLGLDPSKVYGVTFNGNVSVMEPTKLVVPMFPEDMLANVNQERSWETRIGCSELSIPEPD